ncbi:hypothetical protein G7046_g3253 [Stylonectria norvegica]|nr:hypothetical protein G7046_g3253 [Stylonectria norvegica]
MLRIAIAGGGGLGYLIAKEFSEAANAYNVVVLSRTERPEYAELDIQVIQVDYSDQNALIFALQGVNLVISTVSGAPQINLINAAGYSNVHRFVPSEFEGCLDKRPSHNDPLDRGFSHAKSLLRRWDPQMKYTVFSCGIFMERFHPLGLGSLGIGYSSGISNAGDYIIDLPQATAEFVEKDAMGHTVRVAMTSVYDVARFLVAAVDMGPKHWPREYTMSGDRMSLRDLVGTCSRDLNVPFNHQSRQVDALQLWIDHYARHGDFERVVYYQRLLATANGRYDFGHPTLNAAVDSSDLVDVRPLTFRQWLFSVYATS